MNLKDICKTYKDMKKSGFSYEHVEQIMAKIPEELEEVREAIQAGDHDHLVEELGDLIQATLVLSDFLNIDGDQALKAAYTKLQKRYGHYMEIVQEKKIDPHQISFDEKIHLWKQVKEKS